MSSYTNDHKYRSRYASTKTAGSSSIAILFGVFNKKKIIPLALAGYEIVMVNSYPTHARGIIVKYTLNLRKNQTTAINIDCLKTRSNNLKSLASIFQVVIHFHPSHPKPKTLATSFGALI